MSITLICPIADINKECDISKLNQMEVGHMYILNQV